MVKLSRQLTSSLSPEGEDVHLVVLGGDGTANEAVQGIADFSRTRFSYIPTGSSTIWPVMQAQPASLEPWNAYSPPPANNGWMWVFFIIIQHTCPKPPGLRTYRRTAVSS